ncbi:RNA polymerase sigma-70 factor [Niastella caeni]|uniref:RNA polymerase sigma-70 factor n=1 Tax=Niastella caeni TaxID=2569763 RepID=A0A4S8HA62_9BACT|nr:RNA polymerase sigma-70 factor [Niastella caeni]
MVAISDLELLILWQQGNDSAFEAIYKKYALLLLSQAMRKTNDRVIAEEMVHNTFITLYKQRKDAARLHSVGAYLCTILKNKILDYYKHASVVKKYEDFLATRSAKEDPSIETLLEVKELEKLLMDHIEKLPPQCKKIFKLSRLEYLSNKEIAARLQISENTVEQQMRKALKILRSTLLKYDKEFFMLAVFHLLQ